MSHFLQRPWRTRHVLALVLAVHCVLGAALGLSVDEAHYLLYALHPALSYFDHPPMVGWVQWPLVALNVSTAIVRLVPQALWLGTAVGVYQLAVRIGAHGSTQSGRADPQQAGFWAVLTLALAPLLHLLGIGLLPDTLLMFFTVLIMWQTLELMDADTVRRPWPWLTMGLLLGLAGLSKYTAVLAALAVAICLFAAHGVALLRMRWLWLALVLALLLVSPVAVWNIQNNAISFTYQARHGAGNAWEFFHVLQFLLLQILAYGPLMWWAWSGAVQTGKATGRYVLGFFLVPFVVLAALAGGGTSLPHWTAPAWVALAPFAGIGLARAVRLGRTRTVGVWVVVQTVACVALLGLMLSAGQPFLRNTGLLAAVNPNPNPFADLHGWDAAGARAQALASQHHLDSVAVQHWTLASRLAWYARPTPVFVLEDRLDQFTLWAGELPVGGNTLLVDWSLMAFEVPVGPHGFGNCTLLDTHKVVRWGAAVSSFRFYACHAWSGKPSPVARTTGTP